jgi:cysteine-rich secretory family protein
MRVAQPLSCFLAVTALLVFPFCTSEQKPSDAEQFFFNSANRERVALQLQPLKWDDSLAEAGRQHARLMAKQKTLSHELPGELLLSERAGRAGARFSQVGENIAVGPEIEPIHTGWMRSPGHRANILDAHFTALGVGVIEDDGELWAVEDFSVAVANLGLEAQEEKVGALLLAKGLELSRENHIARQLCVDEKSVPGAASHSMLILNYEAPDISKLPEPVEDKIRGNRHRYRKAAVGACSPRDTGSAIPRFRITVVLF